MTTLDTIIAATVAESEDRQRRYPLAFVKRKVEKMGPTRGFARALRQQPFSVIAEIKRKSPSMGAINESSVQVAIQAYHEHPIVSAISVLTQHSHFGGTPDHLVRVRNLTQCRPKPILRKDFIFSPYEVYFSRWLGADAILLMANVVSDRQAFRELHDLAVALGLDVLCEVHDKEEIGILPSSARVCGINSRRFKGVKQRKPMFRTAAEWMGLAPTHDTQTDLDAFALYSDLPPDTIRVAESGVSSSNIRGVLEKYAFNAALIGTSLLKSGNAELRRHLDRIQDQTETVPGGE